jgi:hypothetical protein
LNSCLESFNDGLGSLPSQLEPFCGTQSGSPGNGLQLEELVDFHHYTKGYQILGVELEGLKK